MALTRWSPLTSGRDLVSFQDEVNRLFDSVLNRPALRTEWESTFRPAVDIEETTDEFILRADLPGMQQKDVKVTLMGDTLTIRGERKNEHTGTNGNARRIERMYGMFERAITLDAPVRSDKVKATYRDGVLEVRVPKAEEAKVREIEVHPA